MPDIGRGRDVLHAQPINFALDHRSGCRTRAASRAAALSCDMHMVTIDTALVRDICTCLRRCDVEVAGRVSASAYATGMAALVEE